MSLEVNRLNTIGALYHKNDNVNAALAHYNAALELKSEDSDALANLCAGLLSSRSYRSALLVGRRAVLLHPENLCARRNYAVALMYCGQFEESKRQHEILLESQPDELSDVYGYALLLSHLNYHKEALSVYDKALSLLTEPSELKDHITQDRSISSLGVGDFPNALKEYVDYSDGSSSVKKFQVEGIPLWEGQDLKDKRILVYSWGGYGDAIMNLRFLKPLRELGAKITVAVTDALFRLVAREGNDVYEWLEPGPFSPSDYDYHCSLMRLPVSLGVTPDKIDSSLFLHAKSSDDIGPDGFRVGICWASGMHGGIYNWRRRYVPLELLLNYLLEIPDIKLVSLQKEDPLRDIYRLGVEGLIHVPQLEDFAQTADVIAGLDLVVAPDSAVTHVAGALGKPGIMLGLFTRCWRWWNGTNGLPWYRNLTLTDQSTPGDWDGACRKAAEAVRNACGHSLR